MVQVPTVAVHIRSPTLSAPIANVTVVSCSGGGGATLVAWFPSNETALFKLLPPVAGGNGAMGFNFTAAV